MPRQTSIITPENIAIDYELAGLGSRGIAALIDSIYHMLLLIGLLAILSILDANKNLSIIKWLYAIVYIIFFALSLGYYILLETIWSGQTIGKKAVGLRVVRDGGLPIDPASATIRNLVRLIDFLPWFYAAGIVSIVASKSNKRLGDIAAGTIVLKERPRTKTELKLPQPAPVTKQTEPLSIANIGILEPQEIEALKRYVERRAELQEDVRNDLAKKIAKPIIERLGIKEVAEGNYDTLLQDIYNSSISKPNQ